MSVKAYHSRQCEHGLTDVKVHQTSLSLSTPVSVSGNLERTEGVSLFSDLALGLSREGIRY
jgi:propanediol utilization protein